VSRDLGRLKSGLVARGAGRANYEAIFTMNRRQRDLGADGRRRDGRRSDPGRPSTEFEMTSGRGGGGTAATDVDGVLELL